MTKYFEVQNLSHKFGRRQVLNNIHLAVDKGEVTALIGANGSGKTTLLRIIAGLEIPTDGDIRVRGEISNYRVLRMISTMVFQRAVTFNTSVYDNLAYGLKVRGIGDSEASEKIRQTLRMVGLEEFEKRRARELSGGEQQRVSLARALILEPEILLLDEPTANIDPKNASIIESVISRINRELEMTIIMASHNMAQAKQLANKIAALQNGTLVKLSSTNEVFDEPSSVLENIGRLQNVFSGQAKSIENGITLVDIGNSVTLETADAKEGHITVFIKPEDLIVSKTKLESSARNVLRGTIVEVTDSNRLIRMKVNTGREFTTMITKKSFEEMKLNLRSEVYLTFKAQSVHVIA